MKNKSFIGVFDSGIGGISVVQEIQKKLPYESIVYYADTKYVPYGEKSTAFVFERAQAICYELYEKGAKAIVIACNTATAASAAELRKQIPIPLIGMEPAIKPALEQTDGNVLVLATPMTLASLKFQHLSDSLDSFALEASRRIIKLAASEFVFLVERSFHDPVKLKQGVKEFFSKYLTLSFLMNECSEEKELKRDFNHQNILGTMVLGCTHFIFLKDYIKEVLVDMGYVDVKIIDGNEGTVNWLKNQLIQYNLLNNDNKVGTVTWCSSDLETFKKQAATFIKMI